MGHFIVQKTFSKPILAEFIITSSDPTFGPQSEPVAPEDFGLSKIESLMAVLSSDFGAPFVPYAGVAYFDPDSMTINLRSCPPAGSGSAAQTRQLQDITDTLSYPCKITVLVT